MNDITGIKADESNPRRVNELIEQMVSTGSAALVTELGIAADRARELMRDVAHDVCFELGGGPVYISKDLRFERTNRDMQIFEEWRAGATPVYLSRQHRLTVARVYQIIKVCRDEDRARRQPELPGLS